MDQERINRIKNWGKHLSYKKDSIPGRILKYLDEHGDSRYKDISKNEVWNYTRNLRNLERHRNSCEFAIATRKEELEKWTKEYFKNQSHWLATYKYSDGTEQMIWTDHPQEPGKFIDRFLTYEEHIEYFKEGIIQVQKSLDNYQSKIDEVTKTPGKFFEGTYPPEPNFGQIISIMLVDGTIKKVKRGVYRITAKGKKQLNKGGE